MEFRFVEIIILLHDPSWSRELRCYIQFDNDEVKPFVYPIGKTK